MNAVKIHIICRRRGRERGRDEEIKSKIAYDPMRDTLKDPFELQCNFDFAHYYDYILYHIYAKFMDT